MQGWQTVNETNDKYWKQVSNQIWKSSSWFSQKSLKTSQADWKESVQEQIIETPIQFTYPSVTLMKSSTS